MKKDETAISHFGQGGTVLTGDAVEMFRWMQVRAALKLYQRSGILVTRGANVKTLLRLASRITHKSYKNNVAGRNQAIADLTTSIETLKSGIPVENRE